MKTIAKPLVGALTLTIAWMIGPATTCAYADDEIDPHAHHHMMMQDPIHAKTGDASDPHAHHHHMMMPQETKHSMEDYIIPQLSLLREDGKRVYLPDEFNDGRAIVLNFIFTTCTAICPVTSQVFSQLQSKLGKRQDRYHLISISIDPEHDTPAVLRQYAEKFGAEGAWQFYTGTVEDSIATQQAFGVYRGDKMNHMPVTLIRTAPGKQWARIEGFASADELLHEFREEVAAK